MLMMVLVTMTQQATTQVSADDISPGAVECPDNIIAYWKLDEESGPTYEDFVGNSDASCEGLTCPIPLADGKVNGAQTFSSSTETMANIPANSTFAWGIHTTFSIEYWMRTPASSTCAGSQVILGRDAPSAESELHWWTGCSGVDGSARFILIDTDGNGSWVGGSSDLTDGEWHHVVVMHLAGPNRLRVYVDGAQEGGAVADTYTGSFASAVTPLTLGWLDYSSTQHYQFDGDIDEVAVYRRQLSDAEILDHYQNGRPYCISADVDLEKEADADTVRAGETVHYTYTVTNTGNEPLSQVYVTDDMCSPVTGPQGTTLAVGASTTFSCSQILQATTTNNATVTALDPTGAQVSDIADATVEVINPAITFTKTANLPIVRPGQSVNYTYTVVNSGDVILSSPTVADDSCSPVMGSTADLAPGASRTYTCSQVLTQDTTNTATFTAYAPDGNPMMATAQATVDVINPSMSLTKTAPASVWMGHTVTYTFQVRNTGDDPLTSVSVSDDTCSPVTGPTGALAPGATRTFTCQQVITEDTTNRATATAFDSLAGQVNSNTATATVSVGNAIFLPAVFNSY